MTRQISLEMRAFLFAFIPMALTLVLSFFVIGRAVESRIKDRLRTSLQETETLISRTGIRVQRAGLQGPFGRVGESFLESRDRTPSREP